MAQAALEKIKATREVGGTAIALPPSSQLLGGADASVVGVDAGAPYVLAFPLVFFGEVPIVHRLADPVLCCLDTYGHPPLYPLVVAATIAFPFPVCCVAPEARPSRLE